MKLNSYCEDPAAHGHWCAFTDLYHLPYHAILTDASGRRVVISPECTFTDICHAIAYRHWPLVATPSLKRAVVWNTSGRDKSGTLN